MEDIGKRGNQFWGESAGARVAVGNHLFPSPSANLVGSKMGRDIFSVAYLLMKD